MTTKDQKSKLNTQSKQKSHLLIKVVVMCRLDVWVKIINNYINNTSNVNLNIHPQASNWSKEQIHA